jgi:NADH-quinone oxidoreductase subunit E
MEGNETGLEGELSTLLSESPGGKGALISLLQKVQGKFGYIPEEAVFGISERTGVPASEVFGVLTFYAQFRLEPYGRNVVRVCRGTACHVRGGVAVRRAVEKSLGLKAGETTPDMEYTLETVACIGACALAPTMVINEDVHGQMSARKVEELLADYNGGQSD